MRATGSHLAGAALAAGGAASFGVTIAVGRSLATAGFDAPTVLGIRFTAAAALLLAVLVAQRRPVSPLPGARVPALALGVFYALESTLFFMALERGTAAAVALLFYSYPVVVTLFELATGRGRPSGRLVRALVLSAGGSGLVVLAGDRVSVTAVGATLALLSAATFAAYLVVSDRVLGGGDPRVAATWVALGCGAAHLTRGAVTGTLESVDGRWPQLLGNGVATASAFALMFAGLRLLGPSRTAVVMTLEAFFAIVLAAVFLDEPLGVLQLVGGAAILAGALTVATSGPVPELVDENPEPP